MIVRYFFRKRSDLPWKGHGCWLYLCIFPTRLKVGVTGDPRTRAVTLEKQTGARMEGMYILPLDRQEAYRREKVIVSTLGVISDAPRRQGRPHPWRTEFLPLDALEEAKILMLRPAPLILRAA